MGKTAGAPVAGERAAESVASAAVKIDGGGLVARVLRSQGLKYLFAVNGGHTWPGELGGELSRWQSSASRLQR